ERGEELPRPSEAPLLPRWRQGAEQALSVALGVDAIVEQRDDPAIVVAPDQAAKSLLETDRRLRNREVEEGVLAGSRQGITARLEDGVGGHRERDLLQHEQTERAAWYVDALPEAGRGHQDPALRGSERGEQALLGTLSLHPH